MDCAKCRELLGEVVLGPGSSDPAVLSGEFEEHLGSCYFCQEQRADLEALREDLLPLRDSFKQSFPPVTDIQVEDLKRKVREKVRALEGNKKKCFWVENGRGMITVACLALFSLALFTSGLYFTLVQQAPVAEGQFLCDRLAPTTESARPLIESNSECIENFQRSSDAYTWLEVHYFEAEAGNFSFGRLVPFAKALSEKWPDSLHGIQAKKLLSDCLTQLGEHSNARDVYLDYANKLGSWISDKAINEGKQTATETSIVSGIILQKAETLLSEHDANGLYYCDIILTHFSNDSTVHRVGYILSRYYETCGNIGETEKALQCIVNESKNENLVQESLRSLSTLAFNRGDFAEASEHISLLTTRFPSIENKCYASFRMGLIAYRRGTPHLVDAIQHFKAARSLSVTDPNSKKAERMISLIHQEAMQGIALP